jgi:GT2 family glycosyltransferase
MPSATGTQGETDVLDISIIVINYYTEKELQALLDYLHACGHERPRQVVVIDHSPHRGLGQHPALKTAGVSYHANQHNPGFAAGVNLGLRYADGETIILLNPDTRPQPGCLSGLHMLLQANSQIAAAGPRLLPFSPANPEMPSATRRDPSLLTALVEYTVVQRLAPQDWLERHYYAKPTGLQTRLDCAMVQGACMALSRCWINKVGAFDEKRFFLYWEDTDWCRRARREGAKIAYSPQLRCLHQGGASIAVGSQDIRHFWSSFYAFQNKYEGPTHAMLIRLLLIAGMSVELALLTGLDIQRGSHDRRLRGHMTQRWSRLKAQWQR